MSTKKQGSSNDDRIDPDDAPELTDEMIDKAVYKIGDRVVTQSEGLSALKAVLKRSQPKVNDVE